MKNTQKTKETPKYKLTGCCKRASRKSLSHDQTPALILMLALAVSVTVLFSGCMNQKKYPDAQTIGIAMPTKNVERFERDGKFLKAQFEDAGYNVELRYSNDDSYQQNNDIECLIADKVDILLVCAVDGVTLSQTLKTADEFGIPVIAYDRLIMNTDAVDCYVSFDNYVVGRLQGEFIIDALGISGGSTGADAASDAVTETAADNAEIGGAAAADAADTADAQTFNIEFTAGDPADNNAVYFFNGAYDAVSPYIESGILRIPSGKTSFEQCATESWSTETALKNMQNLLASYYSGSEKLDAVICSNDATALGVTNAIKSDYAKAGMPLITGQDGDITNLRNIVDGKQTMTVYKNVNDEAVAALEATKAILSGREADETLLKSFDFEAGFDDTSYYNGSKYVDSILLKPYVITADNLDLLVDTGLYKWDAAHKYLEEAN